MAKRWLGSAIAIMRLAGVFHHGRALGVDRQSACAGGRRRARCSVAEVNAVLDHHPIEASDQYLRRALTLELLDLDELEVAFRQKALDRDVSAGVRLVRVTERRDALRALNAPIGTAPICQRQDTRWPC
jgi:hypothetical protein